MDESEWLPVNIVSTVQDAFDTTVSAAGGGDGYDAMSPTSQTDAHTLALMLQEQLDAINNEIRSVF